ncbi:hypothetical protein SAMN05444414_11259 [Roseovarius marisflavi]|uniref:Uncharacterized protein n=1 Tax=Roseovarius marisflavi TaxID=1054996 RepID=A0A1M7A5D6_9RHOB|nr:hypothetical protein SAMN05444414_11259 [Roseovarius marisflavi]
MTERGVMPGSLKQAHAHLAGQAGREGLCHGKRHPPISCALPDSVALDSKGAWAATGAAQRARCRIGASRSASALQESLNGSGGHGGTSACSRGKSAKLGR